MFFSILRYLLIFVLIRVFINIRRAKKSETPEEKKKREGRI
ncbi:hypothetical protein [Caloranaerobacter azorensis]|nr:hypothetical protein [Caloranaerobacter azorensis]